MHADRYRGTNHQALVKGAMGGPCNLQYAVTHPEIEAFLNRLEVPVFAMAGCWKVCTSTKFVFVTQSYFRFVFAYIMVDAYTWF